RLDVMSVRDEITITGQASGYGVREDIGRQLRESARVSRAFHRYRVLASSRVDRRGLRSSRIQAEPRHAVIRRFEVEATVSLRSRSPRGDGFRVEALAQPSGLRPELRHRQGAGVPQRLLLQRQRGL